MSADEKKVFSKENLDTYLVATKLVSGRRYKNDLSDIVGILHEHQQRGDPIERAAIDAAAKELYGESVVYAKAAQQLLDAAFASGDFAQAYAEAREQEEKAKEILLEYEKKHPKQLKAENIDHIIDNAIGESEASVEKSVLLEKLRKAKDAAR
jgi:site-specific recombinase XerD